MEIKDFVSTHSRLKAAGAFVEVLEPFGAVSTHSRLKAAGTVPLHIKLQ